jgi:hypothetical protein
MPRLRFFSLPSKLLPMLAAPMLLLVGCGAPMAGNWHGTFDRGPVAAHPLVLHIQDDGQKGWLDVREPGHAFVRFTVCSVEVDPNRRVTLTYDANRPNCDTGNSNPDPSELRTLQGFVGESVFYGDMLRGGEKLGFFRIFRDAEKLPDDVTGS